MSKSHQARGGIIPSQPVNQGGHELRSTYHDSFGGSGGFTAPSYKRGNMAGKQIQIVSPIPPPSPRPSGGDASRFHYFEDRLASQERASQNLLGIKSLNFIGLRNGFKKNCLQMQFNA